MTEMEPSRPWQGSVRGRRVVQWIDQRFPQFVDIAGHDVPNAPRIGTEVLVDNSVADARDCPPGNNWIRGLERGTDAFRGLP
jgi:hypothetical protein